MSNVAGLVVRGIDEVASRMRSTLSRLDRLSIYSW